MLPSALFSFLESYAAFAFFSRISPRAMRCKRAVAAAACLLRRAVAGVRRGARACRHAACCCSRCQHAAAGGCWCRRWWLLLAGAPRAVLHAACVPSCRMRACMQAVGVGAGGRAWRVHASSPRAPTALASCRRRLRAWAWHDAAYGRAGRVLRVCIDRSVRSCMASDFRFKWVMRLEAKSVQPWRRPALARLV